MAYEVVKVIGSRAYRYRVESYRDPQTKKNRARWTYLGRAKPGAVTADGDTPEGGGLRPRPRATREALVAAFGRVAERRSFAELTAGAVAQEAGVAHGTFYRYFKDKRAVLLAAVGRLKDELERVRPSFDPPFGSRDDERARVRAWTLALATVPVSRGVLRAWFDALDDDAVLASVRDARRRERTVALEHYLAGLTAANTIAVERPAALATALMLLVDAVFRSAMAAGTPLDATLLAGVSDLFDRAIFATGAPAISATDTRGDDASPKYPM